MYLREYLNFLIQHVRSAVVVNAMWLRHKCVRLCCALSALRAFAKELTRA